MVQWMSVCVIIIPIVFNLIYVVLSNILGNSSFNWSTAFIYANFLLTVLIAPIFYGGIASYIFSREYREGIAEVHFTYPYKRTSFFIGKMIITFLFIILSCFVILSVNLIICFFFADDFPPTLFIKTAILNSIKISATQCVLVSITVLASISFRNIVAGILTAVIGCSTAIAMLFSPVGDWQLLNPYFFSMVVTDIQNYEYGYICLGLGGLILVGVFAFLSALHLYKNNDITNK